MYHVLLVCLTLVVNSIVAVSAIGQTRFEWPSKQRDIASYKLIDRCVGIATRVRDSVDGGGGILRDTLRFEQSGPFRLIDNTIIATAERCISSIPLVSITPQNTLLAQTVLLMANRDSDVVRLYKRRLDSAILDSAKLNVIVSTFRLLLDAQPSRLKIVDSLFKDIEPYVDLWETRDRLTLLGNLCKFAHYANDMVMLTKYCGQFASIVHALPDGEFQKLGGAGTVGVASMGFARYQRRQEMRDSLATSTSAYVKLSLSIAQDAFRGWSPGVGIWGEKAEPIVADYWFPTSARDAKYPRNGKVTMVLSSRMRAEAEKGELGTLYVLRRLIDRFPDLDVVALSGTTGFYGLLAPPEPKVEAELNYQRLVEFYKTRLVTAVTTTPYWRLPDPDSRKLYDPYAYSNLYRQVYRNALTAEQNRQLGWYNPLYQGVLVDADGVVVDFIDLSPGSEADLAKLIEILQKRAK